MAENSVGERSVKGGNCEEGIVGIIQFQTKNERGEERIPGENAGRKEPTHATSWADAEGCKKGGRADPSRMLSRMTAP